MKIQFSASGTTLKMDPEREWQREHVIGAFLRLRPPQLGGRGPVQQLTMGQPADAETRGWCPPPEGPRSEKKRPQIRTHQGECSFILATHDCLSIYKRYTQFPPKGMKSFFLCQEPEDSSKNASHRPWMSLMFVANRNAPFSLPLFFSPPLSASVCDPSNPLTYTPGPTTVFTA